MTKRKEYQRGLYFTGRTYQAVTLGKVLIVAVANYLDGVLRDWVAYIGLASGAEGVAVSGVKLLSDQAAPFFCAMPIEKYRP